MNRWKREETTTLRLMHAHNQYSYWHACVLDAAESLGLQVGFRMFRNSSGDGSIDREWYVSAGALERVGGIGAVTALANDLMALKTQ